MIKLTTLLSERNVPTPKFREGYAIISFIEDKISEWNKYRIKGASYDDVIYKIPMDVVHLTMGWTVKHIKDINKKLYDYTGGMDITKDGKYLEIWGEA